MEKLKKRELQILRDRFLIGKTQTAAVITNQDEKNIAVQMPLGVALTTDNVWAGGKAPFGLRLMIMPKFSNESLCRNPLISIVLSSTFSLIIAFFPFCRLFCRF